jgi:2-iminobutanoate/2-iminopropanoate deaminase
MNKIQIFISLILLTFIISADFLAIEDTNAIHIDSLDSSLTPPAIGPYSKATRIQLGDKYMLFVSGQIGLNKAGELVSDEVTLQATQALNNLKNLLEENHSSLDYVTKTTVFLADMGDFNAINAIYSQYFVNTLPARSAVAVKTLPKNVKFEIEAIAFAPISEQ